MQFSDFRNLRQALDVGRTLTRFNFPQAEVFNPLGILLAHHLAQLDEAQRTATDGAEGNNPGDQPLLGVAEAILAPSTTGVGRETLQPESTGDGEQGGESGGSGDGTAVRDSRSTDPTPPLGDAPAHSTRVGPTPGSFVFLTESFLDEEPSDTHEDQSSTTNALADDRAEVGTSTQPNGIPEGIAITPTTCPG